MPWINITAKDGRLELDLEGFEGQGCEDVAKLFDELGTRQTLIRKAEFHRGDTADTEVRRLTR
jgi:hypothetical protein